ncbi:hypothetical protein GC173_15440 [bacterium]|nr:hypothetical protein [bacterium]
MGLDRSKSTEVDVWVNFVWSVPDDGRQSRGAVGLLLLSVVGLALGVRGAKYVPPFPWMLSFTPLLLALLGEILFRSHWFRTGGGQQLVDLMQAGRPPLEAYAIASKNQPPATRIYSALSAMLCLLLGVQLQQILPFDPVVVLAVGAVLVLGFWYIRTRPEKHYYGTRVSALDLALMLPGRYPIEALQRLDPLLMFAATLTIGDVANPLPWIALLVGTLLTPVLHRLRRRQWNREPMPLEDRLSRMIVELAESS